MKVAPNCKLCVWNMSFRNVQGYFYMDYSLWFWTKKWVDCMETIIKDLFYKIKVVKLTPKRGTLLL